MRKIFFILFLVFSNLTLSQNNISGTVTNEEKKPLLGVQIYIEKLHLGTTSDENGYFELQNIPNGDHQIIFSYLGFKNEEIYIRIPNKNKKIELILTESVFHMDEVLVSSPFHKIQSENVMKVEYKSIKSLEKNGGSTLIQNLVSIPGVEEFSTGTGIGKPIIRGLSGNRVLIYTQGVRLENQQFGSEHGLGLNEAGIASVEVIKGPASLLYGSDALGGVLYFNPEKFALENETNINISQKFFSNTLGSNTTLGFKSSKPNIKYLIRGTYNTHSDYKIPNGKRVSNTRYNEKDFKAGIGYNSNKIVSELRYNFTKSNIGLTEGIEDQTKSKNPVLPFQNIDNQIISLHNHFFLNDSKIDLDLGHVYNNRKEFEEDDENATLNLKLNTFTYDAKYYLPKFKNLETIVGIQGLHQKNKNFGQEILIPNAKINNLGLLTTVLWKYNDNNNLQGGIRFDYNDLKSEEHIVKEEDGSVKIFEPLNENYQNFTASLGYKTLFIHIITTRINLATGYRSPNLAELTSNGVHEGTFRYEIGNPNLMSEQNFQADLSLEYKNEHFEIFSNAFYNKINNYIFIAPNGEIKDGYDVYTYLQDDAKLFGGEFGFHLHPHPFDWLHLESSFETVTGKQDNGDYLPLIPANKLNNTIRSEFKGGQKFNEFYVALNLETYFSQNKVSKFETESEGYNLLNFSSGGRIRLKKTSIDINFNINNLLNESYISHLSALKIDNIPNIGINFILGINFEF
jgi:iron complex outermembrane receptor protein